MDVGWLVISGRRLIETLLFDHRPRLHANSIIYSPGCGVLVTAGNLKGLKLEQYHRKTSVYTVMIWITSFVELYLTTKQMEYTATQSSLSKVSLLTIGMMIVLDAYLCLLHFATGGIIRKYQCAI